MSNKTQLQTNNTTLDYLISRVNAAKDVAASLPEAGGDSGGSVETCTITRVAGWVPAAIGYSSSGGAFYESNYDAITTNTTHTDVIKNSLFVIYGHNEYPLVNVTGNVEYLGYSDALSMYKMFSFSVTGDGTISITDDD